MEATIRKTQCVIHLDLSLLVTVGPDCDDGEELQDIHFVDIENGIGMDIGDYEKDGITLKEAIIDRLPETIMAEFRKINLVWP